MIQEKPSYANWLKWTVTLSHDHLAQLDNQNKKQLAKAMFLTVCLDLQNSRPIQLFQKWIHIRGKELCF